MDHSDPLRHLRQEFSFPKTSSGKDYLYFTGHSLGLCPRKAKDYVHEEIDRWEKLGVHGHFQGERPWLSYHETVTKSLSRLIGAQEHEVVAMNTLTANLHLMLQTFYRPSNERFKILIEGMAFPSDYYAVTSVLKMHGFDPSTALVELNPDDSSWIIDPQHILNEIEKHKKDLALILIGQPQYLTGQVFDIKSIVKKGHEVGSLVAFDLAHGIGNLELNLHEDQVDFAVWCHYKYLNNGPGGMGGIFVHERHGKNPDLLRPSGWWGQNKEERFQMGKDFRPIPGAEGFQLSNPPILPLASLRASLEIFDQAPLEDLFAKRKKLTSYLEYLLHQKCAGKIDIITPRDPEERGAQLSIKVTQGDSSDLLEKLEKSGIICDFRRPNILRVAPVPLYNNFSDVFELVTTLEKLI